MKQLLVFLLFLCSTSVFAQDVIVKKDGSTILSKVLEVNTEDIKYKKFSNMNGPTYTIEKADIMSINYENGEKEDYANISVPQDPNKGNSNQSNLIQSVASANNNSLISCHNQDNHYAKKNPNRKGSYRIAIAHISYTSILQNSDIEIAFAPRGSRGLFKIKLVNLTNDMLYIDLGNCFRIYHDSYHEGRFETYYDNTVTKTSETSGGNTGAGLNLGSVASVLGIGGALGSLAGGVNVGGSNQHSSTTTTVTYQERFITIPPKSSYILDHDEIFGMVGRLTIGEEISYTESNTPEKRDYIFTYSKDRNFANYGTIKATVYLAKEIGAKNESEAFKNLTRDKNTLWTFSYQFK